MTIRCERKNHANKVPKRSIVKARLDRVAFSLTGGSNGGVSLQGENFPLWYVILGLLLCIMVLHQLSVPLMKRPGTNYTVTWLLRI